MPQPLFARYGAVGFELVLAIGIGFFAGRAIDRRFETHGTALWIGFVLGVACGFWILVRTARELEREAEKSGEEEEAAASHDEKIRRRLEQAEREIEDDEDDPTKGKLS